MKHALVGATVFTGDSFLQNHAVIIANNKIEVVVPEHNLDSAIFKTHLNGGTLAPGFIDLQVNGGGGVFFTEENTPEDIEILLQAHRKKGTTSLLLTVMSHQQDVQAKAINAAIQAAKNNISGVLGVHIEGPFFADSRRGAHHQDYVRQSTSADINWLLDIAKNANTTLMLTLAPELFSQGQLQQLTTAGYLVCAGHTEANYDQIQSAIKEGLVGFTHLYNAMRPLSTREPGVVGAALADKNTWCSIIIDGHHVHAVSAQIAYAAKPKGKMILVSDAMPTLGSTKKSFDLYGETIFKSEGFECEGKLVNAEGRLAGSAIGLMDAVRLNTEWLGMSLDESLRMASLYPAQMLKVDNDLGKIKPGYIADLVHFNSEYRVTKTWISGSER
jgi:N-acetylglucosamine-6-phosphate deacetylase